MTAPLTKPAATVEKETPKPPPPRIAWAEPAAQQPAPPLRAPVSGTFVDTAPPLPPGRAEAHQAMKARKGPPLPPGRAEAHLAMQARNGPQAPPLPPGRAEAHLAMQARNGPQAPPLPPGRAEAHLAMQARNGPKDLTPDRVPVDQNGIRTVKTGLTVADRTKTATDFAAAGGTSGPAPDTGPRATKDMALPGVEGIKDSANPHESDVGQDPTKAAIAYADLAGSLLQTAQRDDIQIEADRRFASAGLAKVTADADVIKGSSQAKKDLKARKEALTRYGLQEASDPGKAIDYILEIARGDLTRAEGSVAHSDEAVPLIDGTYEQARTVKKEVQTLTGGHGWNYTVEKAQRATGDSQLKHAQRVKDYPDAVEKVRSVAGNVREAKMSGSLLSVRVKQFAVQREEALKLGRGGISATEKAAKIVGGMVIGAATGGLIRPGVKSTDGGHSGELDYRQGNIFARIKAESIALKALQGSAAYGRATGFHYRLAAVMRFLRELRDFLGGLTIWLGVIAIVAPPVAPVAVVVGLMVVALAALRSLIGTVLLSWSLIQRATMSNWRAKNTVNAQAVQQGGELLGDLGQMVAPTVAASAGAPVGGNGMSSIHQMQHGLGDPGAGSLGGAWANKVTGVAVGAVAPGLASMGLNKAQTDADMRGVATRNTGRPGAPSGAPKAAGGPGPVEPGWLVESRKSHTDASAEITKALVLRHAGKLAEFHSKTQALIGTASPGVKAAETAKNKTSKIDQVNSPENAGGLADSAEAAGSLADVATLMAASLKRLSNGAELAKDVEADPPGEATDPAGAE